MKSPDLIIAKLQRRIVILYSQLAYYATRAAAKSAIETRRTDSAIRSSRTPVIRHACERRRATRDRCQLAVVTTWAVN